SSPPISRRVYLPASSRTRSLSSFLTPLSEDLPSGRGEQQSHQREREESADFHHGEVSCVGNTGGEGLPSPWKWSSGRANVVGFGQSQHVGQVAEDVQGETSVVSVDGADSIPNCLRQREAQVGDERVNVHGRTTEADLQPSIGAVDGTASDL